MKGEAFNELGVEVEGGRDTRVVEGECGIGIRD
jgi:hypothetical protein